MPRKKTTTITETLPDGTGQATSESAQASESELVFLAAYSKVYRLTNGKKSFCFKTEESIDEEELQTRFPNGGSFAVVEYDEIGREISKSIIDIEPKQMQTTNGTSIESGDVRVVMLRDELQFTRQMLLEAMRGNHSGNGGSGSTVNELAEAVKAVHGLGGGTSAMDMFKSGIELALKLAKNGGTEPEDWKSQLLGIAKENLGPALQLIGQARQTPQPIGQPSPQPNGTGTGTEDMRIPLPANTILTQAISYLKSQIIAGLSVDSAVNWLIENANNAQYAPIMQKAIAGTVDDFIAIDAELANEPYHSWFMNALHEIKEWYAEQNPNAVNLQRGNGNSTDTTINAKASTGKSPVKKVVQNR